METYDERPLHSSWRHRLLCPNPRLLAQPAVQSVLLRSFVLCLDLLAHNPRGSIYISQTRSKILLLTSCAHNFTTSLASGRSNQQRSNRYLLSLHTSCTILYTSYTPCHECGRLIRRRRQRYVFGPALRAQSPTLFGPVRFQPPWLTLLANCHL